MLFGGIAKAAGLIHCLMLCWLGTTETPDTMSARADAVELS
jgi:hypothetical protein